MKNLVRQDLLLLFMYSQTIYQLGQMSNKKPTQQLDLHSSVNTFYIPRILTFSYNHAASSKKGETCLSRKNEGITKSGQQKISSKPIKIKIMGRKARSTKNVGMTESMTKSKKIDLLSSRKYNRNGFLQRCEDSRASIKSQPVPMIALPNHIVVEDFFQSASCDFFSQCNDMSLVDAGERRPLAADDSRKTIEKHKQQQVDTFKPFEKEKQDDYRIKSLSLNDKVCNFKKKRIFQSSYLNQTIDMSYENKSSRSGGRKSIFKQRDRSYLNYSQQKSIERKNKIFNEGEVSPRFGIKKQEQCLDYSQIPKNILESWQQFSESSHHQSWFSSSRHLNTVRESKLQGSNVSEIQ